MSVITINKQIKETLTSKKSPKLQNQPKPLRVTSAHISQAVQSQKQHMIKPKH